MQKALAPPGLLQSNMATQGGAERIDPAILVAADPALGWGLRLAPLIGLHAMDLRAGMVQEDGKTSAMVAAMSVCAMNLQLRFRALRIWARNSSVTRHESDVSPQRQVHAYLLAPLDARAVASAEFSQGRRRAITGMHWEWVSKGREARAIKWHLLQQVIDAYMFLKAADYAMFLLTR